MDDRTRRTSHTTLTGVLLLLTLSALAGCLGDDPASPDETGGVVVSDPRDFSHLENKTGPGHHMHDYWGGKETRQVLRESLDCSSCTASDSGPDGVIMAGFDPTTDRIVPQGTASLHVTVTWDIKSGDHGEVALYVRTANMSAPGFVTQIESGVATALDSTNDDNDPPHQRLSLWRFEVRALPPKGSDGAAIGDYQLKIDVVAERGLPIPYFPPHPDLWGESDEILLHERERDRAYQVGLLGGTACSPGCPVRFVPDEGLIVPYDAAYVEVVFEVTNGLPAAPTLALHGADTRETEVEEPFEEAPLRTVWRVDVTDRADSPYAKNSLWAFEVSIVASDDVVAWTGDYRVTATAVR